MDPEVFIHPGFTRVRTNVASKDKNLTGDHGSTWILRSGRKFRIGWYRERIVPTTVDRFNILKNGEDIWRSGINIKVIKRCVAACLVVVIDWIVHGNQYLRHAQGHSVYRLQKNPKRQEVLGYNWGLLHSRLCDKCLVNMVDCEDKEWTNSHHRLVKTSSPTTPNSYSSLWSTSFLSMISFEKRRSFKAYLQIVQKLSCRISFKSELVWFLN